MTTSSVTPDALTDSASPPLWYMVYGGRFLGSEPRFYNPDDFPWVKTFEQNATVILDELRELLAKDADRLQPYFNNVMVFPPKHWKSIGFYFWGLTLHRNCRKCPRIHKVLKSIPHLTAASLSVLEPMSNINPHQGDTNAIVRGHLGLVIPAGLPDCGFQVCDEIRGWEEGKMLLFCDAHTHTAWNQTAQRRLIMIIDVMRPEFASRTDAICSHVLASIGLQMAYQRLKFLNSLPGRMKFVLHFLMRTVLRVVLPLQRRIPFAG